MTVVYFLFGQECYLFKARFSCFDWLLCWNSRFANLLADTVAKVSLDRNHVVSFDCSNISYLPLVFSEIASTDLLGDLFL